MTTIFWEQLRAKFRTKSQKGLHLSFWLLRCLRRRASSLFRSISSFEHFGATLTGCCRPPGNGPETEEVMS